MMQKVPFYQRIEDNTVIDSIRRGLVMSIPVLMIGSLALILKSLPVAPYQEFLKTVGANAIVPILDLIYNGTFGILALYLVFCISTSVFHRVAKDNSHVYGATLSSFAVFAIFIGVLTSAFDVTFLGVKGTAMAILSGVITPLFYNFVQRRLSYRRFYTDGADADFNNSLLSILPTFVVILSAALIQLLVTVLFSVANFNELIMVAFTSLFEHLGPSFLSAILFTFLTSFLWFFGIHGGDVLDHVATELFVPGLELNQAAVAAGQEPVQMFTKEFFDVFVVMGGCGATLSLVIAMLLFSRHSGNRRLAKASAVPMLFNINEMMVFGLPIVFNPVMLIPFVLLPLVNACIAALSMGAGWVPFPIHDVEWTTPILLGGYVATGSVAGSLLQLFNLGVGVLLYCPFVKLYDGQKFRVAKQRVQDLVALFQRHEEEGATAIHLTEQPGAIGTVAKMLAMDLTHALELNQMQWHYQPQYDAQRRYIGAEALLRWKHPTLGMIYPPLVVKLAEETGVLDQLEQCTIRTLVEDLAYMERENLPIGKLAGNITVATLQGDKLVSFLEDLLEQYPVAKGNLCLEVSEQNALRIDDAMESRLTQLHEMGILLAIDDFSMGSTSLKYLQSSQFDIVKLDGKLVRGIDHAYSSESIVDSIVYLSRFLNFTVVAEYVETEEQRQKLEDVGCIYYQGYLYSPAVSFSDLCSLLTVTEKNRKESQIEQ